MNSTKIIAALTLLFICMSAKALNIQEAMKSGKVNITLSSNGKSLQDGMVSALIQNKTAEKLKLEIPLGTELISEDDDVQNLILVQDEHLVLAPNSSETLDLKGMCIQATNSSPGASQTYSIGDVLGGDLLACATMIRDKKIINHCGQQAIWAFSDNHEVGWIDTENEHEDALRQFVADRKGVENPWYTTSHRGGNNQLLDDFDPEQPSDDYYDMSGAEIRGDFQWWQDETQTLSFAVYDAEGNLVRKFFDNKTFNKGEFTFKFFYKTSKNLRGTYYAKMTCGDQLIKEAAFSF